MEGKRSMKAIVGAITAALLVTLFSALPSIAREGGHYAPGVANIRDFAVAPAGFYYTQYNAYYHSNEFKNRFGATLDSVSVGGIELMGEPDVDVFAIAPTFTLWTDYKILGANYGAYVQPTFGTTSVGAAITSGGFGLGVDDSQFGLGDLFIQPVWLGWQFDHADISLGYGFYAPVGKFDANDADNIGLGFWTNQFQLSTYYYLDEQKATAFMLTSTYEIHSNKEDVDITPGSHFTLDWGISQYLSERLEVGIAGYSQWQVEDDSGADLPGTFFGLRDPTARTEVHAIGGQISYWPLKEKVNIAVRYLHEYAAEARFEGDLATLTLTHVF
jgi:hypothetical protein